MALGHSFASASARPSGIPSLPPRACSLSPPVRRSDIMLSQTNTPKPSAVCRRSHAPPTRRFDIMLTQTNTPKPSAVCRRSHAPPTRRVDIMLTQTNTLVNWYRARPGSRASPAGFIRLPGTCAYCRYAMVSGSLSRVDGRSHAPPRKSLGGPVMTCKTNPCRVEELAAGTATWH